MTFEQLENMITISESDSINKASEDLYITQSALNQQLLKLESELNVKLFNRSKTKMSATEAGTDFIEYAKEILRLKYELMKRMSDYSNNQTGSIRIGLPTVRGYDIFKNVFPLFHLRYPGIKLIPSELPVTKQKRLLANGELDFAVVSAIENPNQFIYTALINEELILATPSSFISDDTIAGRDIPLDTMQGRAFVLLSKDSTMRREIDSLFAAERMHPEVILETSNQRTICSLISDGYACAILPQFYVQDYENIKVYHLQGRPRWTHYLCYPKTAYITTPMSYLLELLSEHCRKYK